jgi:hypothetical protein
MIFLAYPTSEIASDSRCITGESQNIMRDMVFSQMSGSNITGE